MKDYLTYENTRNKLNADTYTRLMKLALDDEGKDVAVLIGHHLTFEIGGDLQTENEVPSADCLMFDHDLMGKVFGSRAGYIMSELAITPVPYRDEMLKNFLDQQEQSNTREVMAG